MHQCQDITIRYFARIEFRARQIKLKWISFLLTYVDVDKCNKISTVRFLSMRCYKEIGPWAEIASLLCYGFKPMTKRDMWKEVAHLRPTKHFKGFSFALTVL